MGRKERRSIKFQEQMVQKQQEEQEGLMDSPFQRLLHKKLPSIQSLQVNIKNIKTQLKQLSQQQKQEMDQDSSSEEEPLTNSQKEYTLNFIDCHKKKDLMKSQEFTPKATYKLINNDMRRSIKLFVPSVRSSFTSEDQKVLNIPASFKDFTKKKITLTKPKNVNFKIKQKAEKFGYRSLSKPVQRQEWKQQGHMRYTTKQFYSVIPVNKSLGSKQIQKSAKRMRGSILAKLKKINDQCMILDVKRQSIKDSIVRFAKYSDKIYIDLQKKRRRMDRINYL